MISQTLPPQQRGGISQVSGAPYLILRRCHPPPPYPNSLAYPAFNPAWSSYLGNMPTTTASFGLMLAKAKRKASITCSRVAQGRTAKGSPPVADPVPAAPVLLAHRWHLSCWQPHGPARGDRGIYLVRQA